MEQNVIFADRIATKMQAARYLPDFAGWLSREVGVRKATQHWRLGFNLLVAQTIREVETLDPHENEHRHSEHKQIHGIAVDTNS